MTVHNLVKAACEATRVKVSYDDVMGQSRMPHILKVRWAVWHVLRNDLQWSCPRIGKAFGKDRTTVDNGLMRAKAELIASPDGPFARIVKVVQAESKDMSPVKKWSDKDTLYLCKMWQSTKTAYIARHLGFCEETIRERARRHGLSPKRENERPKQAEEAEFPKVFAIDFGKINATFVAAYEDAAKRNGWRVWEYAKAA
jgi:hypothetical protein